MRLWKTGLAIVASACVLAMIAGCGAEPTGPERHAVTGAVTFKGSPVPRGEIRFRPDEKKGNKGPGSVAKIQDGRYSLPSETGVLGGAYIIEITGFDGVKAHNDEAGEPSEDGAPLFVNYSTTVEFKKEKATQDFDVPVNAAVKGAEKRRS